MIQSASAIIWTIGHSTRSIDEFMTILCAHGIRLLIDVRTIPRSRHNPQFNADTLSTHIEKAALSYVQMPHLGGLRKARKDSVNQGWRNASFRGYADYMQTNEFHGAIEALMAYGTKQRTAIMCAEAVPWRCHRSLIADALVNRGNTVRHIMTESKADVHQVTSFATCVRGVLYYYDREAPPRLF